MTTPSYSIHYSAIMERGSGTITVGQVVVLNADGDAFVVSTAANRTAAGRRSAGIARTAAGPSRLAFEFQSLGMVPASVTGLGAGTASTIRCSSTGTLERVASPTDSDDVMGRCDADGTAYLTGGAEVSITMDPITVEAGDGIRVTTAGTTTTVHGVRGTCSLEQFGAVGDGATNDAAALELAEAALVAGTYDTLVLGARTYLRTSGTFTLPAGCSIVGQGRASVLATTANAAVVEVDGEDCSLQNFAVLGNQTGSSQHGIVVGDAGSVGSGVSRLQVADVWLIDLGGRGWSYAQNPLAGGASTYLGPMLTNVFADRCGYGFYFDERGEYSRMSNCHAQRCTQWGIFVGAGNVGIANCTATKNENGITVPHATNAAHGDIVGCAFNHNTTINVNYGAILGQKFIGCSIYQGSTGAITVTADAKGLEFIGCQIDVAEYVFATGTTVRFADCIFDSSYGNTVSANDAAAIVVESPRQLDGAIPSWWRTFLQRAFIFASDANDTLTLQESVVPTLIVQDGTISQSRQITNPRSPHAGNLQRIINDNAEDVTFAWTSGTAVTVAAGEWALVGSDGTNAIVIESGGGGSATPGGGSNAVQYNSGGSFAGVTGSNTQFLRWSGGAPAFGNTADYFGSTGTNSTTGLVRGAAGTVLVAGRDNSNATDRVALATNTSDHLYVGSSTAFGNQYTTVRLYAGSDVYLGVGSTAYAYLGSSYFQFAQPVSGISNPFRLKIAAITVTGDVTLNASQQECPLIVLTGAPSAFTLTLPNVSGSVYFIVNQTEAICTAKYSGSTGDTISGLGGGIVVHNGTDYELVGLFEGH